MIASAVRTTIAFRAVLIAVTIGTSTWGFPSPGSVPGRIPTVRPPPRFAPRLAASITPFRPPHTRIASARAIRNPTSSASAFASAVAVFDPPITEMMGFRPSMASFLKPIPWIKLFDPGYQPRFSAANVYGSNRRLSRADALAPPGSAHPLHRPRGAAGGRGALPHPPPPPAVRRHPPGGPIEHRRPRYEGGVPREDPRVSAPPPVHPAGRRPRPPLP